jgi:D-alanyl-D-alanine carboxypeptidase/D-alanyl-D-alanine carboxypeptidase (penicillin-binding protein 5/6)
MQNEEFAKAAASKSATLCYGNPPYRRTLTNHNRLLKTFDGAVGVKTGFTKKSGRCLVTAARRDGKFVIAVTLNDPDDWRDHTALLEYGLNKVRLTKVEPERQSIQVAVVGGVSENIKITIPSATFSSLENEKITAQINLPKFVFAPIIKGEKIGSVVYKKGDTLIKETELLSDDNINERALKLSFWDRFAEKFRYIFLGIWEK